MNDNIIKLFEEQVKSFNMTNMMSQYEKNMQKMAQANQLFTSAMMQMYSQQATAMQRMGAMSATAMQEFSKSKGLEDAVSKQANFNNQMVQQMNESVGELQALAKSAGNELSKLMNE